VVVDGVPKSICRISFKMSFHANFSLEHFFKVTLRPPGVKFTPRGEVYPQG
jgi:hypothetical protein